MEKKSITFMEKMACRVLSRLRYNENDEFYKCWQNDLILGIAWVILGGRNPIDFIIWLLGDEPSLNNLK